METGVEQPAAETVREVVEVREVEAQAREVVEMVVVVVEVEMVAVDMVRGVEVKVVACMVEVGTGLEEAEMVGEGMVDVVAVEGMEVEAVEAEEEMEVVTKEVGQSRLP